MTLKEKARPLYIDRIKRNKQSCVFLNLNWDSVLYLAGKRTEQFLSELLIRQSNDDM